MNFCSKVSGMLQMYHSSTENSVLWFVLLEVFNNILLHIVTSDCVNTSESYT
jgi:hypothetical protein